MPQMRKLLLFALIIMNTHSFSQIKDKNRRSETRDVELTFLHTSDVHGAVFSYNYLTDKNTESGLPCVYALVDSLRHEIGDRLIVTDGGDCLQGQPTAYYSNYVDTVSPHLIASAMNEMGYVCGVMGNHDIEAGHAVYDRWVKELNMPVLGANVIDVNTGKPYFTPYIIIYREGVKIALLGMLTPAIPNWLPEVLWSGMRFEDTEDSSRKWIEHIREVEHPDLIVGVFHSGFNGGIQNEKADENAVEKVARNVPGFDFIIYGHDHHAAIHEVECVDGRNVMCIGPSSDGIQVALAKVRLKITEGAVVEKHVDCMLRNVAPYAHTLKAELFEADFVDERIGLKNWVDKNIGTLTHDLDGMDAYFGPSLFIDFIHQMQLELTGAEISFAAPLTYNAVIKAGPLSVSDMFRIYKYENFLYTMLLTGREIKGFLEMSYSLWIRQMHGPDDHIMLMEQTEKGEMYFPNMTFNFDSAAGILYTVDVSKPMGNRINIISMADGTPFSLDKEYRVAVNSYRGNGGGELLTKGAGIAREELAHRIVNSTEKDFRYYMMQMIQERGTVTPSLLNHWRFVPEEWAEKACQRDRQLLMK